MLGTVNNAGINMKYRNLYNILFSFNSEIYPEVGVLDHMVVF